MPVSPIPCFTAIFFLLIPLIGVRKGRKGFLVGIVIDSIIVLVIALAFYIPGWVLYFKANAGDPVSQYEYARWTENHCGNLNAIIIWPCSPDLLGGFAWLEQAAAQDYPPAVYLVGLRLKYGDFVPKPAWWVGPENGNIFAQPKRGQDMIDRALKLGYKPRPGDERSYYARVFRRN